jgi:ribosomal protein S18 acetylase RimI-like enzyme
MKLRPYRPADKDACIRIFAGNIPKYFAAHELAEFETFLNEPNCTYYVLEDSSGDVIGCGGYYINREIGIGALCWGMVAREHHHQGAGRFLLIERLIHMCVEGDADMVVIDTSQHTAPFFEKSGFVTQSIRKDFYAPGLHRYEMVLILDEARCSWLADQKRVR